jgi:hypothetical protein
MSTATLSHRVGTLTPRTAPPAAVRLMMTAQQALADADATSDPLERYASAHLAALRAAAALLADRARPARARPRRPTSAWTLLVDSAPEMAAWAGYFAAGASKRAAAEAGLRGAVTESEANVLRRDAGSFVAMVETTLGMLALGESVDSRPGVDGEPGTDDGRARARTVGGNVMAARHRRQ